MAGIRETDFTEVEIKKLGIRIGAVTKADVLDCVGKLEEEMECKTRTKSCGSKTLKTRTKGTGNGTLKISAYAPQDMLADLYGMIRAELKDGVIAYGSNSLHAVACVTALILDEDDNEGLYEAVVNDLKDDTVKQKWMEEFSRELVTTVAA